MVHTPRNKTLPGGIPRLSRSAVFAKKGLYKKKQVAHPKKQPVAQPATKTVEVKGAKNGKTRTVPVVKPTKYYPAEDVPQPKKARKTAKPAKLRASIVPGTVLVLLAGRFRGKRVVFLKQLDSGLLLVTGPYKINGVPLRRVNQAYVLATSTKVDVSKVNADKFTDAYFKKPVEKKAKKATEAGMFGESAEKKQKNATRVADQKTVDAALLAVVNKVPQLKAYLNASFSLKKGQAPHLLKF